MSRSKLSITRTLLTAFICSLALHSGAVSAADTCQRSIGFVESIHDSEDFESFLEKLPPSDKFNHGDGARLYRGSGKVSYNADQISGYLFNDSSFNPRASSVRNEMDARMKNGASFDSAVEQATASVEASIEKQLTETEGDLKKFIWSEMKHSVVNLPMSKRSADVLFAAAGQSGTGLRYGSTSLAYSMRDNPGQTGLVEIFDINPTHLNVMKGESEGEYLIFADLPASHVNGIFVGVPGEPSLSHAKFKWRYVGISKRDAKSGLTTETTVFEVQHVPSRTIDGENLTVGQKLASFTSREELNQFLSTFTRVPF